MRIAGGLFGTVEVDLANRPDWLSKITPLGKVPVVTWKEGDAVQTV